jgi:signal peptidase I
LGTSPKRRSLLALIVAVVVVAAVLGAGAFVLLQNTRALPAFIQPLFGRRSVHILGNAMAPTLREGQIVSVDTQAYAHHDPQRGDIIVFKPPDEVSRDFIKRIIALPGERLHIKDSVVYINGQSLQEPYLPEKWIYNNQWPASGQDQLIPPNQYFVLGDNRNHSSDSRTFGPVDREAILGKLLP